MRRRIGRLPVGARAQVPGIQWASADAASLGGDPRRVAVGGHNAGGNLATVVCLCAKERGHPPVFQLLVYRVTDFDFERRSYRDNAEGYFLTMEALRWFGSSTCGMRLTRPIRTRRPCARLAWRVCRG